ncbi:MAG: HEPN domain-containing protein [Candidatus Caldarchaeum sp.]|nr:HEPN domain-containing protein [Candidatus Caldarchaeum sp.]
MGDGLEAVEAGDVARRQTAVEEQRPQRSKIPICLLVPFQYGLSKKEQVNILLNKSKGFLITAEHQTAIGLYDLAAFSLEQSLQLYLKAKLLERGVDFPKSYGVRKLLELLHKVSGDAAIVNVLNEFVMELGILEDVYITSRYSGREFRKEEVERLWAVVKKVMDAVR